MIKNGREYQITKAQAAKFQRALSQRSSDALDELELLERGALASQLAELQADVEQYEALESGRLKSVEVSDLSELPTALIQARISAGLSQRELAGRLGVKEQQVQRYEATEYASASLSRLSEVIRALGVKLHQDVVLPSADMSLGALLSTLDTLGFERKFVESRLILGNDNGESDEQQVAWRTANAIGRVLGISAANLVAAPGADSVAAHDYSPRCSSSQLMPVQQLFRPTRPTLVTFVPLR